MPVITGIIGRSCNYSEQKQFFPLKPLTVRPLLILSHFVKIPQSNLCANTLLQCSCVYTDH